MGGILRRWQVAFLLLSLLPPGRARAGENPRFDGLLSQFIYLKPLEPIQPVRFHHANGQVLDFSKFRGKLVLVNLWATWCAPCAAEMPTLERLQVRLGGDRFAVVAIGLDAEGLPPVAAFFRRQNLTHLQIYLDPEHHPIRSAGGGTTDAPLPLYQLPTSYLLDARGRAVGYLKGPAEWDSPQANGFLQSFIGANEALP